MADDYRDRHKADQRLFISDASGKLSGGIVKRWEAHTSPGVKHLAFAILVLDNKGNFVLHKRHSRKVGGGTLDTPVSHVLEGETHEQAMNRCLQEEYGFTAKGFDHYSGFSYEEHYPDGTCENEYCLVSVVKHSGSFKPNPNEIEGGLVLLPAKNAASEIRSHPKKYAIWFRKSIELLAQDSKGKKYVI